MSADPFEPPGSILDSPAHLGPILFRCRDRSYRERMKAVGHDLTSSYLMPLWVPLIASGLVALGLEKLEIKVSVGSFRGFIGVISVGFGGWFFWLLFHEPKGASLVLHERGFRYKGTVVPFEDLEAIRFGGKFSRVQKAVLTANQALGVVSRKNAAAARRMEGGRQRSITLVYKTGDEKSLDGMQIRPRPEDLRRFLDELRSLRPTLVADDPGT